MEPAPSPDLTAPEIPNGKQTNKSGSNAIEAKLRAIQAMDLRRGGWSYQTIADRLGYKNPSSAYLAIKRLLERTAAEPTEEVRQMELDRLDRMFAAFWPAAIGMPRRGRPDPDPDPHAADRCLAIMRQRASLLGLNAPETINVRALIGMLADSEGFTDDEKSDAVAFVEHHLKEMRGRA